jgi:hypothetical protein
LLDLGHVDIGFNPKNEILRVYAYLREKSPLKTWLAACLWYKLTLEPAGGLFKAWGRNEEFVKEMKSKGITFREWIASSQRKESGRI